MSEAVQSTTTNELSDEALEAATRPEGETPKDKTPEDKPKVEVAAVVEQVGKPIPQQHIDTKSPQQVSNGQQHRPQQARPQGQRPDPRNNQRTPEPSVGNRIKGLENLAPVAVAVAKGDEVKSLELRLQIIREVKPFVPDIIRIWNAGDRQFAKDLFALLSAA